MNDRGHANMPTHKAPAADPDFADAALAEVVLEEKHEAIRIIARSFDWPELNECSESELIDAVKILQQDLYERRQARYTLMGQIMFYRSLITREVGEG